MHQLAKVASITTQLHKMQAIIEEALTVRLQLGNGCPPRLGEAMRYAVLAPGKRLRPKLALLAAQACGGNIEQAIPAACAVEFIHAYSLAHDDLPAMDDDDLRRGQPTCHKQFDEATAILVGDALQALAFEVLATELTPPAIAAQACATLARAAGGTQLVGGQADDLAGAQACSDFEHLKAIHRRKTGAMFLASLELGGLSVNASREQLAALAAYGEPFGLVFQITDDLLDTQGTAEEVGKRVGKDADHGKLTYPGLIGIDESRRQVTSLVAQACQALEPFGPAADPLRYLARALTDRVC